MLVKMYYLRTPMPTTGNANSSASVPVVRLIQENIAELNKPQETPKKPLATVN